MEGEVEVVAAAAAVQKMKLSPGAVVGVEEGVAPELKKYRRT